MPIDYELLQDMINCVKREVKFRYAVYPRRVASGNMTNDEMVKEQRLMCGVLKTLQKIYDGKAPQEVQKSLFDMTDFKQEKENKTRQWYEG